MKNNESGRSMIEMLGVLAIFGILSVGGIAAYSKALAKHKNNTLITQVGELVMSIRSAFSEQQSFSDVTIETLYNIGAVPMSLITDYSYSDQIIHIFNGEILFYPSLIDTGQEQAFEVYILNLSRSTCTELLIQDWGQDIDSGLFALYVNNNSDEFEAPVMQNIYYSSDADEENNIYTVGTHENALPVSVVLADKICDCGNSNCLIGFKYK